MGKLLDSIQSPLDLRTHSTESLKVLCKELREELIKSVSESGGHFASSLGATEITVALHKVFDTPNDRIVWDTGHQGYIHKMLTGRREQLPTIRKKDGISGFLKREESEFDTFGAGHAGTSISAAVGMKVASPEKNVVAVIGDGSITAGMAFEALNHAGSLNLKGFVVVINDNEMSISENVGALSWAFSRAVTSKFSTEARKRFKSLHQKGFVPEIIYKAIDRAEEATQGFLATPAMLFEALGFRYIGPIDGHDLEDLIPALENAKNQDGPVVIHAVTVKGKGYNPAEEDPITWHGVTPFNPEEAKFLQSSSGAPSYTSVFSKAAIALAKDNKDIIAITAAMPGGTGLDKFQKELPEQFFDVGICEQHAVTFAAGLAAEGKRPICAIYSTFLQRGFDQVVHDVCVQNLPVCFAMDRSGLVGNDGETHQGLFDIAFLKSLPNMVIMSPKDENELQAMVATGVTHEAPTAIRYPRGSGIGVALDSAMSPLEVGKGEVVIRGEEILLICLGPMVQNGLLAGSIINKNYGINPTVVNARFVKPLDIQLIRELALKHNVIATIEDHSLIGGFGAMVVEALNDCGISKNVIRFGVGDHFVPHASQNEQYEAEGLLPTQIAKRLSMMIPLAAAAV